MSDARVATGDDLAALGRTRAVDRAASEPPAWRQIAGSLAVAATGLTALLVVLGLGLTHLGDAAGMRRRDAAVDAWLAARRTASLDLLTQLGSGAANTQTAIAVGLVAVLLVRWWLGRWYEAWVLAVGLAGELLVFLVVTASVHRQRPDVPRLDQAPPTSSFPSGHTAAAVVLYGGLGYLLLRYARQRLLAVPLAVLLSLLPVAVAASRLYRGMHYPTDVLAGALGGGLWLFVVLRTMLPQPDRRAGRLVRSPA